MDKINPELDAIVAAYQQRPGILNDLVAVAHRHKPLEPFPACASCPVSLWFTDSELACFCKVRKELTWGKRATAVRACAEREMILAPPESS